MGRGEELQVGPGDSGMEESSWGGGFLMGQAGNLSVVFGSRTLVNPLWKSL